MSISIFGEKYDNSKKIALSRDLASVIINSVDEVGTWVKDTNFRFLDVSESVSWKLYGIPSSEMIGKTDYEVAKSHGVKMSQHQFAELCLASDSYILNSGNTETFIEHLTGQNGDKMIWRVIKGIKIKDGKKYLWGSATFLCKIFTGYEQAMQFAYREKPYCKELNSRLWVYKSLGEQNG